MKLIKHKFLVNITVDSEFHRQHVEMYVRDALTKYRDDPILNLDRRHVRVRRLPQPQAGRITLVMQIESAIASMGREFKSAEVYAAIPKVARSAIKGYFWDCLADGRLKIAEAGRGQRPTVFRKI